MSKERNWIELRIGITDAEAIAFLEELADEDNDVLRKELERNPREALLKRNIDLAPESAPDEVKLPPRKTIARYVQSLRSEDPFGNGGGGGGGGGQPPHGYVVLYVVHGNGTPPPSPPGDD